ncbi:hypothetical protein, conserved [Leishmania tarentolae]|uniref:Uncharacterized protein n=1 Tax=Leishmania tarentolae TaxID=5689 RepID=A0A640KVQ1_LEITA|nr:hypothetical protein, conserved [Leishmania tarentolae]
MPPRGLSQVQRPRHIAASTHVLATRLAHNTAERVTVGNTPLHVLHLCDVQCVAPLFASCVSLTTLTIHLKYVASSTALEALLCAASASPTLTRISMIGGVTPMESVAMASGLAAFTWNEGTHAQRVSRVDATSESPLPRTTRRAPSAVDDYIFMGGRGGERESTHWRRYTPHSPSAALSPYARAPLTHLQRQRCVNSDRAVSTPFSAFSRTTQWRRRRGGMMWPVPYDTVSPRDMPASRPAPLVSSPDFLRTPPSVRSLSAHHIEGGVYLTLELHRLEEATAALLVDGLRRAHRIISAEVRLCVASAEARRAGQCLVHEAKKAAAHHRQRRWLLMTSSVANTGVPQDPLQQARAEGRDFSARCGRPSRTRGLRVSPRPGVQTSVAAPPSPPQRLPASPRPLTAIEPDAGCPGHEGRRALLPLEGQDPRQKTARRQGQRLAPRCARAGAVLPRQSCGTSVQPHTPLTPFPSSSAGGGATMRAQRPVFSADELVAVHTTQTDAFRRRGRHASPPLARVGEKALSRLVSPHRHLARAGRLYSPPRWVSRAQLLTNGAAPPPLALTKVVLYPTSQAASARRTSSPAELRRELCASSSSSWSSRSSSPPPRPPQPSLNRDAEAFANFGTHEQVMRNEKGEHATRSVQRTPPGSVSARLERRGLGRFTTLSARQPHSPSPYPGVLCSPRYCLRRGSDSLGLRVGRDSTPHQQTVSRCSSSRCSCFVCCPHSPRSPTAITPSVLRRAAPTKLENSILALAAETARAPRRNRLHKRHATSVREVRDVGDVTPARHSAVTSVNGITPTQRRSGGEQESDSTTSSHEAATSASFSSRQTSCSAHTREDGVRRSLNIDLVADDHSSVRHSSGRAQMDVAPRSREGSHLQVSHTHMPASLPLEAPDHPHQQQRGEEVGYVVYQNSVAFLRERVTKINRHVVWHQVQAAKAVEAHSKRLAELGVTFSDRVTEELTDILMVLTDMEHGSRISGRR